MSISIRDLFRVPVIYSMDFAPSGGVILYSSNITGIPHLYVQQAKKGSRPKQITKGTDAVMFGFLSPHGDQIIYLQDKDGNELHHLYLTSVKGERRRRISKNAYRTWTGSWHPKGEEFVRSYVSQKCCGLEVFNVKSGESFVLKEQKAPLFEVRYSHNGKWLACTEWGGGKDPKNVQVTVMKRENPEDVINYKLKDGSKEMLPSWASNDKRIAFLSDVKGRNQVVVQEFQGEERRFLSLGKGEEAIDTQEIGWAPKGDKLYYIVSKRSRTGLYEHPLEGEKTALPFPEGTTSMFKVSKDGKTIAAVHSSMLSPHGIYMYSTVFGTVIPVTSRQYKVNMAKLSKPKSVWCESSDGLKIHAWYLPAGNGTSPHPAVVWPHGGPWWQTFDTWSPYMQSISQSGFAVLAPNFRGSTGYGAKFRNMDLSDPGGGDLEDVVAGAKWLTGQPEISKSKIAIAGGSYGGFMTLIALTKKPKAFAAGAALVPVTDWLEIYKLSDPAFRKFMDELFEGPPKKREKLYRKASPITYVSQIKAPVLIVAGRHDSRCPIQPIEKFVKKLEEMRHPHEFRVQEKEGHGLARVKAGIQEVSIVVKYLRKTLRAAR
jgi:dipeptidyl aminopeptidase/acylaminoacyl peptidase